MSTLQQSGNGTVAEVRDLRRAFKRKVALEGVSLTVPRGAVYGLVGENGAGKTTLIKHLLGVYRAQAGSVRVFGHDPVSSPVEVLSQVGYLSEDRDLPGWMRIRELLWYTRAFYPGWDDAYAESLRAQFGLPPDAKIRHLSRGEKAKAGLLIALAYRPALLLLDEPSSGLDAAARRDILAAIVRTVADEGRTVIFSSHLLDEVERVADTIAMIHEGNVLFEGAFDTIRAGYHRAVIHFEAPPASFPEISGVLHVEGGGHEWTVFCNTDVAPLAQALSPHGGRVVEKRAPSLEEIFLAHVGRRAAKEA